MGEPSPSARLWEARSFVELRMLDRAWVRLKDLVESDTPNVEALTLAAEMFVLRGWPNKAKRAIQRGLAIDPANAMLKAMAERTQDAPTEPDEGGVEAETTPIADLIRVAEQFMAHGSFVRARTLLERVKKKVPEHRWASDLMWAMDGDFAGGDLTLADLCDRFGPEVEVIHDMPDEPEHTESAHLDDLPLQIEREDDAHFPSLFRNLGEPKTEAYTKARDPAERSTEPEVTAVRSLASVSTLGDPVGEGTDPQADDTQIVRVINRTEGAPEQHTGGTTVDSAFNLADYRRQMGVDTPELVRDYVAGPEDEDDSVVVHTRRDDSTDGRDATTDVGKGLSEDAAHEQAAKERRGAVEDAGWAAPVAQGPPSRPPPTAQSTARTPVPAGRASSPRSPRSAAPAPRRSASRPLGTFAWPWWVLVFAAILAAGFVVFALIAIVAALQ